MNIFDELNRQQKIIDERAIHLAELAFDVDCLYEFQILPWIRSSYTTKLVTSYTNEDTEHGKEIHYVSLTIISEQTDQWDDCYTEEWYQFHDIPLDLALHGSDEKLTKYFKTHFSNVNDIKTRRRNESNYMSIFELDLNLVNSILSNIKNVSVEDLSYSDKLKILVDSGVDVFNRGT